MIAGRMLSQNFRYWRLYDIDTSKVAMNVQMACIPHAQRVDPHMYVHGTLGFICRCTINVHTEVDRRCAASMHSYAKCCGYGSVGNARSALQHDSDLYMHPTI